MFQFRAFPSYAYLIQRTILRYCLRGFPHSEISGSTDICSSPKLIAACHVLRRLLMPRHSPCALYSLTLRDILVLLLELCRQSTGYFRKIVIVTHIFSDVPQLKFTTFLQLPLKPSVALLSSHFNTLFSFQGAIRQHKLRIMRRIASDTAYSLRCVSSSSTNALLVCLRSLDLTFWF